MTYDEEIVHFGFYLDKQGRDRLFITIAVIGIGIYETREPSSR